MAKGWMKSGWPNVSASRALRSARPGKNLLPPALSNSAPGPVSSCASRGRMDAVHEAWAALMRDSPNAVMLMHLLVARVGEHNAVVVSQKTMAKIMSRQVNTVKTAFKTLRDRNWIEIRQVGERGTVNACIINDRVAWTGKRDGIRYSLFSTAAVLSDDEQPDRDRLDQLEPLRRVPSLLRGEQQLPSGDSLPPPSEPALPGVEPDLPATSSDEGDG